MDQYSRMRKDEEEGIPLPRLFKQLADEASSLVKTEVALAKAETVELGKKYIWAIVLGVISLLLVLATIVMLAQAGVLLLLNYISSPIYAHLLMGLFLIVIMAVLLGIAMAIVKSKHRPVGLIFKLFSGR